MSGEFGISIPSIELGSWMEGVHRKSLSPFLAFCDNVPVLLARFLFFSPIKSMANLQTVAEQIRYVLMHNLPARDDDLILTMFIWKIFYPRLVFSDDEGNPYVKFKDLGSLPREDHVKRIRAKIQNEEGIFLPTNIEVARKRRIAENTWHIWSQSQSITV